MSAAPIIYKICPATAWRDAVAAGQFAGYGDDFRDDFIHFSTAEQVRGTAARHFAGRDGLVLVAIDADRLGPRLRWEPSRAGALFPHLYGVLPIAAVLWAKPLPLDRDRLHLFPELGA